MTSRARKLKVLEQEYSTCVKCPKLAESPAIFGFGNIDASLVVIGGSPRSDIESDDMLDRLLRESGINVDNVWKTNTCLCRPKETNGRSRQLNLKEINNCKPRLTEEVSLVAPKVIVVAGNPALLMVSGKRGIGRHRGWLNRVGQSEPTAGNVVNISLYATVHPASLLSGTPDQIAAKYKLALEDWRNISYELKKLSSR